jgi:signal transduction histidine kinase
MFRLKTTILAVAAWTLLASAALCLSPDADPMNSAVLRELNVWERYGTLIFTGVMVLVLQTVLIVGLVISGYARVCANRALQASREEARQLSGRLLSAQEDERRRVAREMHDDLSQRLATSAVEAGMLEQRMADRPAEQKALGLLRQQLVDLSDDIHHLSRQLHPAILEDLGLAEALRTECESFARRERMAVDFRCRDLPDALPKDLGLCCYRIAQESLRNIVKHSQAAWAEVLLQADDEFLYLDIRDSGSGFEPEKAHARPGIGLASMQERARLVGGQLTIQSQVGAGTTIALRIPLVAAQE